MKKELSYFEHLLELRKRILYILLFFLLSTIFSYFFFSSIITTYLINILKEDLYVTKITEAFTTKIKISFYTSFFLTVPFAIFQITIFIFPALTKKEKVIYFIVLISSTFLFLFGFVFAFKILIPLSINFLKSNFLFSESIKRIIDYSSFVSFFFNFLIASSICFLFPVVSLILLYLKFIKLNFFIKGYKYVIIFIFVIAAILTPPDVLSQILVALPLLVLYLITILIAIIFKFGK